MNESFLNDDTAKATVVIEKELYERVKKAFHYGQMSKLFRNLFETLDVMIENGEIMKIVEYIYKNESLLLIPIKEEEDNNVSDG